MPCFDGEEPYLIIYGVAAILKITASLILLTDVHLRVVVNEFM
jgi:hypothetical protein